MKKNLLRICALLLAIWFCDAAVNTCRAQGFSDFHAHITMKNYYRQVAKPFDTASKFRYNYWYHNVNYANGMVDANFRNFDQCTFYDLAKSPFSVVVTSISPIEKSTVLTKNGRSEPIKLILGAKPTTKLKYKRLTALRKTTSYQEFLGEYLYLAKACNSDDLHNRFRIINSGQEISINSDSVVRIVLSVEGGHIFFDDVPNRRLQNAGNDADLLDALTSIDKIKALDHRIFFVTLDHMWWNKISGQAKALYKPDKKKSLLFAQKIGPLYKSVFNKHGSGIYINSSAIPKKYTKHY
jgi:hypothetical protein